MMVMMMIDRWIKLFTLVYQYISNGIFIILISRTDVSFLIDSRIVLLIYY